MSRIDTRTTAEAGFFDSFGGRYVAEVLRQPLIEVEEGFHAAVADPAFQAEIDALSKEYVGRPTPLLYARNTSEAIGGARIYVKLEGLANTGAHKINNAIGQALLAKRMGKRRIIAETGAGQHGLATAAVCATLGFECTVYMGAVDVVRQRPNVFWMEMYGAQVVPVESGSRTLKDAVNEALRDWSASYADSHYLIGSALGPAPYPAMVHHFQSVIGRETETQLAERGVEPTALVTCVGGGSNAVGFFAPYFERETPRLVGVEAGGRGGGLGDHAARMSGAGRLGIVQGYKSLFLLDEDGQVAPTHSISAGLDYPGIGPELAAAGSRGRVEFRTAGDHEALEALKVFARNEGIAFALESAHGAAEALKMAAEMSPKESIVVNMSGRGDKDLFITARALQPEAWHAFLSQEAATSEAAGSEAAGSEAAISEAATSEAAE